MQFNTLAGLSMTLAATSAVSAGAGGAGLVISEVVDGPLPGGQPKWVEITNCGGEAVDWSAYSIGVYNNGSTLLGNNGVSTLLLEQVDPIDSYTYVFSSEADTTFETVYGLAPQQYHGLGRMNGDDVVVLFLGLATGDGSDATIVDTYGVIGVDGTGEVWDYTDSYAVRNAGVMQPNATFDPDEWFFAGREALATGDEKEETLLLQTLTFPGTHDCTATKCPEDIDGNGDVGFSDILFILGAWGDKGGPADLDGSGDVGFGDILRVLGAWGPCPGA